jgi:hypothetical protein
MLLYGCPYGDDGITHNNFKLENASNQNIFIAFDINHHITNYGVPNISIPKDSTFNAGFNDSNFNGDKKLWIFVYKESTINEHTYQEIRDQNIYDQQYELTIEQLQNMNYHIVYTGY